MCWLEAGGTSPCRHHLSPISPRRHPPRCASCLPPPPQEVQAELEMHSGLRMSRGRKVLEVRPDLEWDKGRALTFLMQLMELDRDPDAVPIYLGDDRTDEDAFRAVADLSPLGFGILVSSVVKPTAARYTLRDPSEVERFLRALAQVTHPCPAPHCGGS